MVLRLPGVTRPGMRVTVPVETRALHATLLDYLGVAGAGGEAAASLLPLLRAPLLPTPAGAAGTLFSQVWLPDQPESTGKRVRRSLARRGRLVLIRDHDTGEDQLFSVDAAAGREARARAPEAQRRLGAALDAWTGRMAEAQGDAPAGGLSEDERRRLEALGYL
jgi:hypothetical protein